MTDPSMKAMQEERERCLACCDQVAAHYPIEIFPEDGESLDCKSAKMARKTCENIKALINEE